MTQESYYKDNTGVSMEERMKINYDHPDAFDMPLLEAQLSQLMHRNRLKCQLMILPLILEAMKLFMLSRPILLSRRNLVLFNEDIRNLMDIKVYVDTDDDIRFIRRLERDMKERGRSLDSVINQYLGTVKPMYNQFIEPTKRYADIIVPEGGENDVAIDHVNY